MQHVVFSELIEVTGPPLCGSKRCTFTAYVVSMAVEGCCLLQISHQLKYVYDLCRRIKGSVSAGSEVNITVSSLVPNPQEGGKTAGATHTLHMSASCEVCPT